MTATDVLTEMVQRIVERFHPLRVVLFGSRARGDARPDSDYDLLVVMPDGTDRRAATVAMLGALNGVPAFVDVVVTTPESLAKVSGLRASVLIPATREGITIYES